MDSDFIVELFAPFGPVTVRRMFGGAGLFAEGLMFGLVFDGAIFLKVDDSEHPRFRARRQRAVRLHAGQERRPRRPPFAAYWRLPERLYDDPEELASWAQRAFAIAQRKKTAPRARPEAESKEAA